MERISIPFVSVLGKLFNFPRNFREVPNNFSQNALHCFPSFNSFKLERSLAVRTKSSEYSDKQHNIFPQSFSAIETYISFYLRSL